MSMKSRPACRHCHAISCESPLGSAANTTSLFSMTASCSPQTASHSPAYAG